MYSNDTIEQLIKEKNIILYSKVQVLDWSENVIRELKGITSTDNGSITIDGNSAVRRSADIDIIIDNDVNTINEISDLISTNSKIRLYIGIKNKNYQIDNIEDSEVYWFNMGIFVLASFSVNYTLTGEIEINLTLQDKMNLLNGVMSGDLSETVRLDEGVEIYEETDGTIKNYNIKLSLTDILYNLIQEFGKENPAKIMINDIPSKITAPLRYIGETKAFMTNKGTEVTFSSNDIVGYKHLPFVYQGELVKLPGETIYSIIEDIKNYLGNFEFFYDENGNFVFQEMKNYINSSFVPITELQSENYLVDYSNTPYIYSFNNTELITGLTKEEDNKTIRNDFKIMGINTDADGLNTSIIYHVIIYPSLNIPYDYNGTWQDYIIEKKMTDFPYYNEISSYWPTENGNGSDYIYYFDIIDSNSVLGKYSIDKIGYRTKVVYDENINTLYPFTSLKYDNKTIYFIFKSDYLLYIKDDSTKVYDESGIVSQKKSYENNNQEYIYFDNEDNDENFILLSSYNDAYTKIRELLYSYTSYADTISIKAIPLYFLDVNKIISMNYKDIKNNFFINNISIPFSTENEMTISATKIQDKI